MLMIKKKRENLIKIEIKAHGRKVDLLVKPTNMLEMYISAGV
jgi:hypothetical protein